MADPPDNETSPPAEKSAKQFFLDPGFKYSLICVAAFTLLALATSVALAVFANPSDAVKSLIETLSTTYKMGFGALVGLVGGKRL